MLFGFVGELIFGISIFWMVGGAAFGAILGMIADFIRSRFSRPTDNR